MTDFSKASGTQSDVVIGTDSLLGPSSRLFGLAGASSAAWPIANTARFFPVIVTEPFLATQMFVFNGTAVSGNVDVGIYTSEGKLIVSMGTTAQSGTSAIQTFNITDTLLNPDLYYIALALSNTTGTFLQHTFGDSQQTREIGVLQMASAFPLPASATFATSTRAGVQQVFATRASVI